MRYFRDNRGMALILVIMMISILLVVTLDFHRDMRSDLTSAANVRDGMMLRYVAKSGFNCAMAILAKDAEDDEKPCDTLSEDWANRDAISAGASLLTDSEGVRIAVEISDCSAKIQVNSLIMENGEFNDLQQPVLERYLNLAEFDLDEERVKSIVDSIKDWIDDDNEETGLSGAEDSYYQSQDTPYTCENGPIRTIASLRKVRGLVDIPQEMFDKIAEHLTPDGDGKININTADLPVLQALAEGISPALADDIVAYRKDESNDLCSLAWYKDVPGMCVEKIDPDLITVASSLFRISTAASIAVEDGATSLTKYVSGFVERVEKEGKKRIDVLYWQNEGCLMLQQSFPLVQTEPLL